jgi:ribosome maturation factor RimP
MPHPVIPQVLALAEPVAKALELEIVDAVYHTQHQPPTLRVDVRNNKEGTGLEDCERMSRSLETALDDANVMPEAYVLEVSSPGLSQFLTQDRDFAAFRGFPVTVQTTEPFRGQQVWIGTLTCRDQDWIHLNQKGRPVSIPRTIVSQVQLQDPP